MIQDGHASQLDYTETFCLLIDITELSNVSTFRFRAPTDKAGRVLAGKGWSSKQMTSL